jgi:curli biogenesis system outer membrane secretion channel CsgG
MKINMKKHYLKISTLCLMSLFGLSACNKASEPPASSTAAQPTANASNIAKNLDVGKIEQVSTTATGSGITPGAAVNDALKTAVMQVNGSTVNAQSANLNYTAKANARLDVQSSRGNAWADAQATLQSQEFADLIVTESKGVVSSFRVVKTTPPADKSNLFTVEIEAKIAKFKAPSTDGKLKIVVAPLTSSKASFNIGGRTLPATEVLTIVHQQIVDALTQTGRFIVLDRQFEGEIQSELDMINLGQTANTDFAKLGQAFSADLIWVGVVNDFSYDKHVRQLQMSDRELVSFSGGWSVSQRMINLSTRQILQSTTIKGSAPAVAPTTLGTNVDSAATIRNMSSEIVKKTTEAIMLRTFPITIAEREGNNVVLNQGGSALVEKSRYMIYLLGKEIKDPQTGLSLGNMESACCEVVINRVTPNLSYGVLENIKVKLDAVQPGALQIREMISSKPAQENSEDVKAGNATIKPARKVGAAASAANPAASAEAKKKDDW